MMLLCSLCKDFLGFRTATPAPLHTLSLAVKLVEAVMELAGAGCRLVRTAVGR